jgi:hypothetical protein
MPSLAPKQKPDGVTDGPVVLDARGQAVDWSTTSEHLAAYLASSFNTAGSNAMT